MAATGNGGRIWEIFIKASIPVVLACGVAVITHEVRLGTIEANRFTDRDGWAMEQRIVETGDKRIRADLAEIKAMLQGLDKRLREIEKR